MDGEDHLINPGDGSGNGTNGQQAGPGLRPFLPPNPRQPLIRPPQFQPQNHQQQAQVTTDVLMLQVLQQIAQQLQQQQAMYQQQNQTFLQQQGQMFRNGINVQVPPNPEQLLDSLASNIKEFRFEPDQNVTFAGWFARYKDLFEQDAVRLDDPAKTRLLLRKVGPTEYERYCNYILPQSPNLIDFDTTVAKLKSLFGTTESVISRRYRCLQVTKQATEDYKSYACRVNKLCVDFELGRLSEHHFKCLVFVCGLKAEKDAEIRTRLLSRIEENAEVTLEQISDECQRILNIKHDTAMIESASSSSSAAVQAVKRNQQYGKRSFRPNNEAAPRSTKPNGKTPGSPCWNCGSMHFSWDCPFAKHRCRDCGQVGHKDGYCSSARKSSKPGQRSSRPVETKSVVVRNVKKRRKFVQAQVNGRRVALQLDTASDISVISEQTWREIGKPAPKPATVQAATASGQPLKLEFQCATEININGVVREGRFYVVKQQLNLLGLDLIDEFDFWSVPINQFCNQVSSFPSTLGAVKAAFPAVFNDAPGLCTKAKVKFSLKDGQTPVFRPKRPVAYAMCKTVSDELERLEHAGIISPVEYSEWATPIVVVRKASGAVRICGDYSTGLNDALQPHQYPLPIPQDIFAGLANCKVFSQIDLSDAYLQVEVDEDSRELLTINTHRGLYRYNRLSPGVKPAPGAFQQIVDTMMAGANGAAAYLDDILVGGVDEADHWRNLQAVLKRIQDYGFTIKAEKCSFAQRQIKYLGHLIDEHGLRPDPAKLDVIRNLPAPKDVSGVRSFLGAINYYGKFVPSMRTLRYPLDELLKTTNKFVWTAKCQEAFERFKAILSSDLLLTHYDPAQEIIVSADASSIGIGATISHRFPDGSIKVVQHASRALTSTEQAYSQPDREGLAIIYAVTKFHKMLFGRRFLLQTDHAPLLRIFGSKKGIPVYTANRLQRYALQLLLYDFKIAYVSTEKFGDADVLSRLIDQHAKPDEDFVVASITLEEDVRSIVKESINALPLSFRVVQQHTKSDPVLRKVLQYIQQGWPKSKTAIADRELKVFFDRRDSLCTVQGCVTFAERLAIPSAFRARCLQHLHRGHPGIERMKALARSYVYWPSIDADIAGHVGTCRHCAAVAKSPPKAPPQPWPKSTFPWQRVHVDYAGPIEGDYFLLCVDSYSKWVEITKTKSITASATIAIVRSLFARLGMPETLVSDNGTQFTSAEFGQFCLENGINHMTTAPFHPQSNGQAERFVDTFKRAVKKIREGRGTINEALDTFLLTYRSTPNPSAPDGKSPSEAMFGRKIRTSLDLLRPPAVPVVKANEEQNAKRSIQKGDCVYVKIYSANAWRWAPGVVLERLGRVMFNIWAENKRMIRSHLNQLRFRTTDGQRGLGVQGAKPSTKLPLDILLKECILQRPSTASKNTASPASSPQSAPNTSSLGVPSEQSTPIQSPQATAEATNWESPRSPSFRSATASPAAVPSTSKPVSSPEFLSASENEPAVPFKPRRSSRHRRVPIRFDPYQLF